MKKKIMAWTLFYMLIFTLFACQTTKKNNFNAEITEQQSEMQGDINPSPNNSETIPENETTVRIAAMKGPTGMGLATLLDNTDPRFVVDIFGSADELLPKIIQKEVDIAMIPANVASILYEKTGGEIEVFGLNTWGALYLLDRTGEIKSIEDLDGKTIYSVGQGTTPEYALAYVLSFYDIDVLVEFKAEATELASLLAAGTIDLALLPEPLVSTVLAKNEDLKIALSLQTAWEEVSDFSMVTGVCVVQKDFLAAEKNKALFEAFLNRYEASVAAVLALEENAMKNIIDAGILPNEEILKNSVPRSGITFVVGEEMKRHLSAYLEVLYEQNPPSIGGRLPDENFYKIDEIAVNKQIWEQK